MIICYIFIMLLVAYLTFSNYRQDIKEHNKLEEFFNCLEENKKSRFWIWLLLLRRTLFVVLLVTWASFPSRQILGVLIFLQVLYYGWLIYVRPYKEIKENIIELLNEAYFITIIVVLIFFNTENDWTQFKINTIIPCANFNKIK